MSRDPVLGEGGHFGTDFTMSFTWYTIDGRLMSCSSLCSFVLTFEDFRFFIVIC